MTNVKIGKIACTKCGKTADQLLVLALAISFGARTKDPTICIDGKEHKRRYARNTELAFRSCDIRPIRSVLGRR